MLAEASERGVGCPEGRTSQEPAGEEAWGSYPGPGRRTRSRVMQGRHSGRGRWAGTLVCAPGAPRAPRRLDRRPPVGRKGQSERWPSRP